MTTKIQDAESIIEDEEIVKTLDLKSMAEDVLVIKAEMEAECDEGDEECMKQHKLGKYAEKPVAEKSENTVVTPAPVTTPVEKSFAVLVDKIAALKSQGTMGDAALNELQTAFDELGSVVKSEFTPKPTPEDLARKDMEVTLRSALQEMLPQALAQVVAPLQSELAELRALQARPLMKKEETPKPRNLSASLVQKAAIEKVLNKSKDQFQAIADASVGLPN